MTNKTSIAEARRFERSFDSGSPAKLGGLLTSAVTPRLAVICDLLEENWPSMDLVAEMVVATLQRSEGFGVQASRVRPDMVRRFSGVRPFRNVRLAVNADRFLNRFWDYPRSLGGLSRAYDLFHIVDHSYAHLVHALPPHRTIVTCHDLDAFRCLVEPDGERRGLPYKKMAARILSGLRKAAHVTCVSATTRDELLRYRLVPPDRLSVIANGVHPVFSAGPDPKADEEAARLLGPASHTPADLLHVGSTVPRKGIEVLLRLFAEVRTQHPGTRLVRVGGQFTRNQERLATDLEISDATVVLPVVSREVLAAVYRRASLVLLPSRREGFGLPVIEALACNTPVVASDLSVIREVGGDVVEYCRPDVVADWTRVIVRLLQERATQPAAWQARRRAGRARAERFDWTNHTTRMVEVYTAVLNGTVPVCA